MSSLAWNYIGRNHTESSCLNCVINLIEKKNNYYLYDLKIPLREVRIIKKIFATDIMKNIFAVGLVVQSKHNKIVNSIDINDCKIVKYKRKKLYLQCDLLSVISKDKITKVVLLSHPDFRNNLVYH